MDNKNNPGYMNSGNRNSGYMNSGNWNSGDWNSGYMNSGDWNSGNWNSGNWNSGNWNSGYLNTDKPKIRIFNQYTELEEIGFPNFFYFDLNTWVEESDMTDKEKDAYPSYATCGGYLKCRGYKQAWRESWDKAELEDRKKVLSLPNWDNAIFLEITGIDVEKELNQLKMIDDELFAELERRGKIKKGKTVI
jgi:hypothetical protein